jgi:hypothetical protein
MIFASPEWLFGLLLLPVLALVEAFCFRRDRDRVASFVARPLWPRVVRAEAERWRFIRLGLVLAAAAGLTLALARPQWGVVREKVEREGADIVLLLDSSGSMATADVPPSRFFLAPRVFFQQDNVDLYFQGLRVAEYRVRETGASLDFGRAISRNSELRLGYEVSRQEAGVRVSIGVACDMSDDGGLERDDRVTADPVWRCGVCFWCARGEYHICPRSGSVGLAQLIVFM